MSRYGAIIIPNNYNKLLAGKCKAIVLRILDNFVGKIVQFVFS